MSYVGVIEVTVVEARSLVAADKTGSSDPYVVLKMDKQKQQTSVVERNLSPAWNTNNTFSFYITKHVAKHVIQVALYDYDEYSKHDSLGECVVQARDLVNGDDLTAPVTQDLWLKLKNTKSGEVHLVMKYRPLADGEELNIVFEEDENDPELKPKEQGVRYWPLKGSVYPPSNYKQLESEHKTLSASAPRVSLQLEYVHGYRGYDCRDNLHYNVDGHLVYHAAAVGIVYDGATNTQKFYHGHSDDIVSLALHPNQDLVATGQVASISEQHPPIHIWSSKTLKNVAVIKGFHTRSVTALSFSDDGKYLVSVGTDDHNSIAVYDVESAKLVADSYGHSSKIFGAKFFPGDNTRLVTFGVKHVRFWTFVDGKLNHKDGVFQQQAVQTLLSAAFLGAPEDPLVATGTYHGEVYVWKGPQLVHAFAAHEGPVYGLLQLNDTLITGGKDGQLKEWNVSEISAKSADLQPKKTIFLGAPATGGSADEVLDEQAASSATEIRTITHSNGVLAVGTKNSEIHQIDGDQVTTILNGHTDELWALATHPTKPLFVTGGNDHALRVWDVTSRVMINGVVLENDVQSVAYSPKGEMIAAGLANGTVQILDGESLGLTHVIRDRVGTKIDDLKFSPDGQLLAVGSHANVIDIYHVTRDYKRVGVCKGHTSFISHLDWSRDSKVLQTDSGSYEHLFWDVEDVDQITKSTVVRDIDWNSWTCILGWHVRGIWPKGADGTDINAACRSHSGNLVATADDNGQVNLFNFPVDFGAKSSPFRGHSAHVSNVRFTLGDSHVISTGGNDRTIFQWRVVADTANTNPSEVKIPASRRQHAPLQSLRIPARNVSVSSAPSAELVNGHEAENVPVKIPSRTPSSASVPSETLEQIRQEMREIIRNELTEYKTQLIQAIVASVGSNTGNTSNTTPVKRPPSAAGRKTPTANASSSSTTPVKRPASTTGTKTPTKASNSATPPRPTTGTASPAATKKATQEKPKERSTPPATKSPAATKAASPAKSAKAPIAKKE